MMDSKITKYSLFSILSLLIGVPAQAKEIDTNMAQMQAMDKITGRVSVIDVPVNGETRFGSFSIVVRACKTRPPEETPENYAFVDVVDSYDSEKPVNIFKGWMLSSSPALNAVAHPIYDVWLLKCYDGEVDKSKLLTADQLKARDEIAKAEEKTPAAILKPEVSAEIAKEENEENKKNEEAAVEASENAETQQSLETLSQVQEPSLESLPQVEVDEDAPKSLINLPSPQPQEASEKASVAEQKDDKGIEAEAQSPALISNETEAKENLVKDGNDEVVPQVTEAPAENTETVVEEETEEQEAEPLVDEQFIDFSAEEVPEDSFDLNVDALRVQ